MNKSQLAALLRNKPRYSLPAITQTYIVPEVFEGDPASAIAGSASGFPAPTLTNAFLLAGVNKGTSYTTAAGDAGKQIMFQQTAVNAQGTTVQEAHTTVQAPVTFGSLALIGGNVSQGADYSTGRIFFNTVFDGRGFGVQGTNAKGGVTLDANGWPTQASQFILTAALGSASGQLAPGTYHGSYKSVGQTSVVTLQNSSNCSISNIVNQPDGVTTTFDLTIGVAAICSLYFSGGITSLDVPRDGSYTSIGKGMFNPTALAHYAQFSILRLMDFCGTNGATDTTWSSRIPNYAAIVRPYAWETIIAFINAVAAYPGSKLKKAWINTSGYIDANYATQLSALLNSYPLTSAVQLYVEVANEPWNGQFAIYGSYCNSAVAETQCLTSYLTTNRISSVVRSGNVVTVTLNISLPAYVTVGASFVGNNRTTSSWSTGSLASPTVVTAVGANSFSYAQTGSDGTMTLADGVAFYFNLSSTLITDNLSFDLYNYPHKWYIRQAHTVQQAWAANRPQDRFVLNIQLYGGIAQNGGNFLPVHYGYASYIGGGNTSWLYGTAVAPYIKSAATDTTTASVLSTLTSKLPTAEQQARAHVYACRVYGLHPIAYEGGPDLQATPNLQVGPSTDPGMGTVVSSLLTTWFKNGGEEFCFYNVSPSAYLDGNAQGAWSAMQDYSDTTAPKLTAVLGAASTVRDYANIFGSPGDMVVAYFLKSNGNVQGTSGICYFSNSGTRFVDFLAAIPRSRRYTMTVWGTDAVGTSTVVTVSVDGVSVGTATLPANGRGDNGATVAGAAAPITVDLTGGVHWLDVQMTTGTSPGILKVALAAL